MTERLSSHSSVWEHSFVKQDGLRVASLVLFNLFSAVLGLWCCVPAFSSYSEQGSSLRCTGFSLRGLLIEEHGLQMRGPQQLGSAGLAAPRQVGPSRTRIQPVSPAAASGFLSTGPPGKSLDCRFLETTTLNECRRSLATFHLSISLGDSRVLSAG